MQDRTQPPESPSPPPPVVWTVVGVLIVLAVAVGFWVLSPALGDRLLTIVVAGVLTTGVVAQRGSPRGSSRLPAVAQGALVGSAVGVAVAVVVVAGLEAWGLLSGLVALPGLYPAVVPARWRRAVTMRWSDLAAEGSREQS